jgi:penicillin-binding protein 2
VEVNASGQVVGVLQTVDALPGQDIQLTLDYALQRKAELLLDGRAGAVVAIAPDSGKILAMASSPAYDPNLFVTGLTRDQWNDWVTSAYRPLENKAIQGEYPPASVYKIVTGIAGLEEGIVDAQTSFYCPGHYQFGNRAYRCWKRGGHGNVDFIKAMAESCDVYFYRVGEALGVDRLAHYAHKLGLGHATGFNVDREARGLIPTAQWKLNRFGEPWQRGENLSIAIGQSFNLTTPLQLAVMTAAVSNGGTRFRPYLVDRVQTADGQVTFRRNPRLSGNWGCSPAPWRCFRNRCGRWSMARVERQGVRGSDLWSIQARPARPRW